MRQIKSWGFTLVELMIVVAIIAMLAALAVPRLIGAFGASKLKTVQVQVETLSVALDTFHLDAGRYPTQQEGLQVLVINSTPPIAGWKGPYLKKIEIPKDAWGNDFAYQIPPKFGGVDYDLYSLGADGKPGGDGDSADIGNWGSRKPPAPPPVAAPPVPSIPSAQPQAPLGAPPVAPQQQ